MMMARSSKGMIISQDIPPVHAFFVVASTPDRKSFYLHALMWLIQISEGSDFYRKWIEAGSIEELRSVVIDSWNSVESETRRRISNLDPEGKDIEFPPPP